jgi:hypothetical protein
MLSLPIVRVDSMVIKGPFWKSTTKCIWTNRRKGRNNLCLDKAYHSKELEQELSKDDTYHIYRIEEKKRNAQVTSSKKMCSRRNKLMA